MLPIAVRARAKVLVVGGPDDLAATLDGVQSVGGLEVAGAVLPGDGISGVVDALSPDLAIMHCDSDGVEALHALKRMRGRHQCDVLMVVDRPGADVVLDAVRLGVFACLVAPVEPHALRVLLESWTYRWHLAEPKDPREPPDEREADVLPGPAARAAGRKAVGTTLDLVAKALRERRVPLSASEVGTLCNLSAVATRRYLNQLVDRGEAVMSVEYGKTGRPRHLYRWTLLMPG
ncbi:hypothetical protein [Amycolatopsis coloradensis]|uniref:hypothetical protein n=1 Tax=Amycolatopsis coloradensis TaxID=76021 RepID=UPI00096EEF3D|nr:hypothetical protein [Amycolatopsis coloradensis]